MMNECMQDLFHVAYMTLHDLHPTYLNSLARVYILHLQPKGSYRYSNWFIALLGKFCDPCFLSVGLMTWCLQIW